MSDRVRLAREIAARTKPRFIDTTAREGIKDLKALARRIATEKPPRFITIPSERGGAKVSYTKEQLTAMRGGLAQGKLGATERGRPPRTT